MFRHGGIPGDTKRCMHGWIHKWLRMPLELEGTLRWLWCFHWCSCWWKAPYGSRLKPERMIFVRIFIWYCWLWNFRNADVLSAVLAVAIDEPNRNRILKGFQWWKSLKLKFPSFILIKIPLVDYSNRNEWWWWQMVEIHCLWLNYWVEPGWGGLIIEPLLNSIFEAFDMPKTDTPYAPQRCRTSRQVLDHVKTGNQAISFRCRAVGLLKWIFRIIRPFPSLFLFRVNELKNQKRKMINHFVIPIEIDTHFGVRIAFQSRNVYHFGWELNWLEDVLNFPKIYPKPQIPRSTPLHSSSNVH